MGIEDEVEIANFLAFLEGNEFAFKKYRSKEVIGKYSKVTKLAGWYFESFTDEGVLDVKKLRHKVAPYLVEREGFPFMTHDPLTEIYKGVHEDGYTSLPKKASDWDGVVGTYFALG
jgi:hypothetical protein